MILDKFYGSESGNEVFVIFPSAYIASQHMFGGDLNDGFEHIEYNDNWIWPNTSNGIPLNSGIVFIPKNAKVDKYTGSKYLLDHHLKPILKEDKLQLAENTISSKDYWEDYFKENPESKPVRIFYYEGETGTDGLNNLGKKFNGEEFYSTPEDKLGKVDNVKYIDKGSFIKFEEMFAKNENYGTEFDNNKKEDLRVILEELNIM